MPQEHVLDVLRDVARGVRCNELDTKQHNNNSDEEPELVTVVATLEERRHNPGICKNRRVLNELQYTHPDP